MMPGALGVLFASIVVLRSCVGSPLGALAAAGAAAEDVALEELAAISQTNGKSGALRAAQYGGAAPPGAAPLGLDTTPATSKSGREDPAQSTSAATESANANSSDNSINAGGVNFSELFSEKINFSSGQQQILKGYDLDDGGRGVDSPALSSLRILGPQENRCKLGCKRLQEQW